MTMAICVGTGIITLAVAWALLWRWITGMAALIPDHDNP
jgi:hypothetical protein